MIPRLNMKFPVSNQCLFLSGNLPTYNNTLLLNHARTGFVLALKSSFNNGARIGVVTYNCHTVANAVLQSGCTPVFIDITEDLKIDIEQLPNMNLDAIIVTNLFGIHNDINSIKSACPNCVIIVDNAHGYGIPPEGDFTVYSINQGKFPVIGEGGILISRKDLTTEYNQLKSYSLLQEFILFIRMLFKSWMFSPLCYWFIRKLKNSRNAQADKSPITIRKMANGIARIYNSCLPNIDNMIDSQRRNAEFIIYALKNQDNVIRCWYGENAFMLIVECKDVEQQRKWFANKGIETATHFKNCINWAKEFGYIDGSCPVAESMVNRLLMVPTYKTIKSL